MKYLVLIFLLSISFGLSSQSEKPKIHSVGMGTVNAFPNAAQITIGFYHVKSTLREAINENQRTMDEVLRIAKKYLSDSNDLKTSLISTGKATRWDDRNGKEVFIGFSSSQKLIFTIKELQRLQDFTEELLKTRFNKIENISYYNTDANEFIKQAEELAVIDAFETTNRLAKSSKVRIGKVLYLNSDKSPNDNSNNRVNTYSFESFGKGMGGKGVSSSGELIRYSVTVTMHTEILD